MSKGFNIGKVKGWFGLKKSKYLFKIRIFRWMLTYLLLANFLRLSNEPLASEAEKWATIAASSLDFMAAIIGIMADPGFEEYKIILTVSLEILSKNNW